MDIKYILKISGTPQVKEYRDLQKWNCNFEIREDLVDCFVYPRLRMLVAMEYR